MEKCIFCGTELVNGKCPNQETHLKLMCLNCNSCTEKENSNFCQNKDNMSDALEKIKQSVPAGYEITNLEISPLPLKDVTKKCKRWQLRKDFAEVVENLYK